MKKLSLSALAVLLLLSGCSQVSAHEPPMAGSPSTSQISDAFTSVNYEGKNLTPRSEDNSVQVMARMSVSAAEFKEKVTPPVCEKERDRLREAPQLRWDNVLAADPQRGLSAQVFLAPSEEQAGKVVADMVRGAQACSEMAYTQNSVQTTLHNEILLSALASDSLAGANAVISSVINRGGKTEVALTSWQSCSNIVISLSQRDFSGLPHDVAAQQDSYIKLLFAALGCK